jgi:threonine/homoserine/homoserine lactone efflux protein
MYSIAVFTLAAIALLGSPGPAIAALLVVGRSRGWSGSMPFYLGLQVGLAAAAAVSAAGLAVVLEANPSIAKSMTVVAVAYLAYLALKTISARPTGGGDAPHVTASASAGLVLGATNPKAYVAFASLMASQILLPQHPQFDMLLKWFVCVVVMVVVDLIWLFAGIALGMMKLGATRERALNLGFGVAILLTALAMAWEAFFT